VLSGLGGIGKTQIAVAYAYLYRDEYQYILWATAESNDMLAIELVYIARALDLPEKTERDLHSVRDAVLRWLYTQRNWLLILDNVDEPDIVDALLPRLGQGHVLVTTQDARAFPEAIKVDGMEEEEAILFLLHRAGILSDRREFEAIAVAERITAKKIVKEMDGLPLALDQAGAYINETHCTIGEYLELFRSEKGKLLAMRGRRTSHHQNSLTATISLALEKINQVQGAYDLLRICAFLRAQEIPEELFVIETPRLEPLFEGTPAGRVQLSEAMKALLRYSLINRRPDDKTISVHRLMQVVPIELMDETLRNHWAGVVIELINSLLTSIDLINWPQFERYIAHALVCVDWIDQRGMETADTADFLAFTGDYLHERAQYAQAEALYKKALAIRDHILPTEHPDKAKSLYSLGVLSLNQGNYTDAEKSIARALELFGRIYKSSDPLIQSAHNTLGEVYFQQGKYRDAERIFLDTLEMRTLLEGEEHPLVGVTLELLGHVYDVQGRYEEAEYAFQRALHIGEHALGSDHPDVVKMRNALAMFYMKRGLHEKARALLREVLEAYEQGKAVGASELDSAEALRVKGLLHLREKEYERALPLLQQALSIRLKVLGQEHPDVAESRYELGVLYLEQGQFEKAEPSLWKALRVRRKVFVPLHINLAQVLTTYGRMCDAQGRQAEAEWHFQQALEIVEHIVKNEEASLEMIIMHGFLADRLGLAEYT
jgi:tetratricopeptide (TPR) repeat protein